MTKKKTNNPIYKNNKLEGIMPDARDFAFRAGLVPGIVKAWKWLKDKAGKVIRV